MKGPEEHVAIGYCHNGTVTQEWMHTLVRFVVYDIGLGGRWTQLIDGRGPYIANSRNEIVTAFLRSDEAQWLWFLDIDMIWDPDTLERLFALAHPTERPVVAAAYVAEVNQVNWDGPAHLAPKPPVCPLWTVHEDGMDYVQLRELPQQELVPITSCGMGCTLIHRSVLEAVAEAHADDPWTWFGHDLVNLDGEPKRCGEDVSFCHRARALGFSLWGAPDVRCGHLRSRLMTVADITPVSPVVAA